MKIFKQTLLSLALISSLSAMAAPVVIGAGPVPATETSLQTIVNGLYGCGTCSPVSAAPNVANAQFQNSGQWGFFAGTDGSATMIIELAGNRNNNIFGIYDLVNGNKMELFTGNADVADIVSFSITATGAGIRTLTKRTDAGTPTAIFPTFTADNYFTSSTFGFYMEGPGGTFYSESGKNVNGNTQLLAYQGKGDTIKVPGNAAAPWTSQAYIFAWEDLVYGTHDNDFNDAVMLVSNIRPVPEPGSLALLGLGLAGLAAVSRRKQSQV